MPTSLARAPGETTFSLSIRRSTAAGIAVSLAVHLLALLFFWQDIKKELVEPPPARGPISAHLRPPDIARPGTAPQEAQPEPAPQVTPAPRPAPRPRRQTPQRPALPPIITQRAPSRLPAPAPAAPSRPLPEPFPEPPRDSSPETDMSANMAARRADREALSRTDPAQAGGTGAKTADQIAMDRINENLRRKPGTNGIFTITNKGIREATISFRGWTTNASNSRNEVIAVDAGFGGDIDLAIIRKIIEVIRRDYQGDFNWESFRLNKVVILSARPKDTAQLEAFLRQEFFGGERSRERPGY